MGKLSDFRCEFSSCEPWFQVGAPVRSRLHGNWLVDGGCPDCSASDAHAGNGRRAPTSQRPASLYSRHWTRPRGRRIPLDARNPRSSPLIQSGRFKKRQRAVPCPREPIIELQFSTSGIIVGKMVQLPRREFLTGGAREVGHEVQGVRGDDAERLVQRRPG